MRIYLEAGDYRCEHHFCKTKDLKKKHKCGESFVIVVRQCCDCRREEEVSRHA